MHILSCAQFFACSLAQNELDVRENQEEGESFFLHAQCQVEEEEEESGGKIRKESQFFFLSLLVGKERICSSCLASIDGKLEKVHFFCKRREMVVSLLDAAIKFLPK